MKFMPDECRFIRDQLRQARASAQLDAEGFHPIVTALERLGSLRQPNGRGLGDYREILLSIASRAPSAPATGLSRGTHTPIGVLYDMVRDGRNDAFHQGAYARHLVRHCVELALLIEEGLMADARVVADLMVREPVCAEPWQPVALARQQMLVNSFSYLPIRINDEWRLVSDYAVAAYLGAAQNRRQALAERIEAAVVAVTLCLDKAAVVPPDCSVSDALKVCGGRPVLVVNSGRLVGIATPFDLL